MNAGTAWSVINLDPKTSATLPEAVWYEELTSDNNEGFFVSMLQRWDIASDAADFKSVFYQVSPFPVPTAREKMNKNVGECRQFSLRLPRQLAVFDEKVEDQDHDSLEFESASSPPRSPRMQKRRVPLLARFTENQKVFFMQFSPTYIRVAVPDTRSDNQNASCNHWTVELKSCAKDLYAPVPSSPEAMPKIRISSSLLIKTRSAETILPGGIFWLDQSYGNARGSDYQEFMLVVATTKSLLCYKVTLNSLKKNNTTLTMTLAHIFSHPQASAAWWAPKSLVLVVGSYQLAKADRDGQERFHRNQDSHSNHNKNQQLFLRSYFFGGNGPFTSHREVLRNPLLLPLRLERPPPVRFEAFPVGSPSSFSLQSTPTNTEGPNEGPMDSSLTSSPSSISKSQRVQRTPPIQCVSVVQLYGKAFIVEVGAETTQAMSKEHSLNITLHELDRDNFRVKIRQIQQQAILPKMIRSSKEDILVTTLDDIICVTFRRSKLHVFLDIKDVDLDCSYVVEKFATENEHAYLRPATPALFISPGHLFLPQKGVMIPVELDLERLAPSVSKHDRCNFSMLLRRRKQEQSTSGRDIAVSRFSAVGALSSAELRLKWIYHAASVYARCSFVTCSPSSGQQQDSRQVSPLQWDLHSTLHLMFQCAMLPKGAEFQPTCDFTGLDRLSPLPRLSSSPVLFQTDLLNALFVPRTWKILTENRRTEKSEDKVLVIRRIAELAVSYLGALEHHGSMPCPALECFVFAILWRLGDAQVLFALLKSSAGKAGKLLKAKIMKGHRTLAYLGTKWHAVLIVTIVNSVEFGSLNVDQGQLNRKIDIAALRNRTLQVALAMLSSGDDYRLPADLITQFLLQHRLLDAMTVASSLLDTSDREPATGKKKNRPSAALIQAKRLHHGEDFLEVARALLTCCIKSKSGDACRLLQSLHSFLLKWDPECFQQQDFNHASFSTGVRRRAKDDLDSGKFSFGSAKKKIFRRPSWISMAVGEASKRSKRRPVGDNLGLPAGPAETSHWSKVAKCLPFDLGVAIWD